MPKQRWYKGFSYRGNTKQLIELISKKVQQHNLSQFVPLVRVEKGAKCKRFYFFIAIESGAIGEMPDQVESTLLQLPFFKDSIKGSPIFTYEEIKNMVGAAHHVEDYTNPIPYQPVKELTDDNPFDFTGSPPVDTPSADVEELSSRYEHLLYWLSALGGGTWESFKKACVALKLEEPKRILRRLRLLGHIETSPDGSRWSAAPTALVKVKSEFPEFILCGQRSLSLLEQLKHCADITNSPQPSGDAPPIIRLQLSDPNLITRKFPSILYTGEASSRLVQILPTLATWQQSLRCLRGIVPSLYELERFDGNNFVSCISPEETGMYQMRNPTNGQRYTLFYDRQNHTWLQGDWYGLRFLAIQQNDAFCQARYETAIQCLAIRKRERWPEIYERALVLASGYLPMTRDEWLLYRNVSIEAVRQLSDKLKVQWEEASIPCTI